MPYVSCTYAPPDPMPGAEPKPDGQKAITCIDDQGQTWFLSEDSQVGDWLRYVENGGTVAPYEGDVKAKPAPKSARKPAVKPASVDPNVPSAGNVVYGKPLPE